MYKKKKRERLKFNSHVGNFAIGENLVQVRHKYYERVTQLLTIFPLPPRVRCFVNLTDILMNTSKKVPKKICKSMHNLKKKSWIPNPPARYHHCSPHHCTMKYHYSIILKTLHDDLYWCPVYYQNTC